MSESPGAPAPLFSQLAGQVWYYPVIRGVLAIILGILALVWPGATVLTLVLLLGAFWVVDGIVELVDGIRWRGLPGAGWRIFFGIVSIIAGLVLLFRPGMSLDVIIIVGGIWAILGGIFIVVAAFQARPLPGWGWTLFTGIVIAILGILLLVQPGITAAALVLTLGIWAIVVGLVLVILGFQIRSAGKRAANDARTA
ncbi:protein of unknown function DUF308 membrane [Beutenbergia cavernae DSM 12333]|uniref:HdeD family acid-resistance protein n=1 Tax=Beutenbergia cavernae (strain ATCC BAA-8 / DSM 12333 / CCUG 43141 / JCM 11478 / NBRC 16432 / NCIMB 13614 / HKI 0122) TaxID=471853 RepID=C5C5D2_BEUC1|nr:HdeD family acid-resistance protein [Beutenbergia cavernae]ACQ82272.1 protein of unknown function DUF308 membrane [Beutenbergia cavernae DSM 12333]